MKIRIRVGSAEIEYEGAETFLEKKLPWLIDQLSKLSEQSGVYCPTEQNMNGRSQEAAPTGVTLASFLKTKEVGKSQVKRFLATAVWLHQRGSKMLQTSDVTKALLDSHQSKLSNPADCLNKNVTKGYCEKHGKDFFVTGEGKESLA